MDLDVGSGTVDTQPLEEPSLKREEKLSFLRPRGEFSEPWG